MVAGGVPTETPPAPLGHVSSWVPAVVSLVLRPLIEASETGGRVLGSSRHAVWLRFGEDVVVVHSADAVQLPNGLRLGLEADRLDLASVPHAAAAVIGSSSLVVGDLCVRRVRWWDPQVRLGRCRVGTIKRSLSELPCPSSLCPGADAAARSFDSTAFVAATASALGRGEGLTPESDDYLAGLIGGLHSFAECVGNHRASSFVVQVRPDIVAMLRSRTSALSASLIQLAFEGRMAEPIARLARAVAGRGDSRAAYSDVLSIGHTSGRAIAAGFLAGARIAIEGELQ